MESKSTVVHDVPSRCSARRRSTGRLGGILAVLALVIGVLGPASLAIGTKTASASPASCFPGANCPPGSINFLQQGSYDISGVHVCGLEGAYAPLASSQIHATYDDPSKLGSTTEGNYTDSEAFQFTPATTLGAGDTITIRLPHPAEAYSPSGSILPAAQVPTGASSVASNSTVVVYNGPITNPGGNSAFANVEVHLPVPGDKVRLDAFNPYNPPSLVNAPGPNASGNTSASIKGFDASNGKFDLNQTVTTDASGNAFFEVDDSSAEVVVAGATDVTSSNSSNWIGINQSAPITFLTPTAPSSPNCSGTQLSSPSNSTTSGFTYLLIENNVGYLLPTVTAGPASGVETATLTVPHDVPSTTNQVTVVALDAMSPPGEGTPSLQLPTPNTPYPPDAFSISTTEDPVPGFPQTAPVFQADASDNLLAITPGGPVDQANSSLISPNPTATAGSTLTATTTLRDLYNNAVNNKQVSVVPNIFGPTSHANVSPQTPPTKPLTIPYPVSGTDGTVTYNVTDTCAETVNLTSVDVSDNVQLFDPFSLPVNFTAAATVAPDGMTTPSACGQTPVNSSVTVSVDGVQSASPSVAPAPADGTTPAVVTVTAADQYGNPEACHKVVLSASPTSNAIITPQTPAHPCSAPGQGLPGYTGTDGVASFSVTDATPQQAVFNVTDTSSAIPTPWPAIPKDEAQINFEKADPTQSTVVASPTTAPADGQPTTTVTVTVKDGSGQLEQGKNVALVGCTNDPNASPPCSPDPTTTITPPTAGTGTATGGNEGQAIFEVGDNSSTLPHLVYYQASVPTDSVTIGQTASVNFTKGGASLTASNATVVADGTDKSTLTFTLQNTSSQGIPGVSVNMSANPPGATISPQPLTTDGSDCASNSPKLCGTATFTVSSNATGPVSFTAKATYNPNPPAPALPIPCVGLLVSATECDVTATATVTFISKPNTFTLSASPSAPATVLADGGSSSQVTVTALDTHGTAIGSLPISIQASGSSGGTPQITPANAVTNGKGQATFSVTDTTPENVTVTAEYQDIGTASGTLYPAPGCTPTSCSATIIFVPTEAEQSTILASGPSTCAPSSTATACAPADGVTPVTITVTLKAGSGTALGGHSVLLNTGSGTASVSPPSNNPGAVTDANGNVSFTITDTQPEGFTVYARDANTGAIITRQSTTVPSPPSVGFLKTEAQLSTIVANPTALPAGGPPGSPSMTTVTVALGLPAPLPPSLPQGCPAALSGHTVKLTTPSGTANISPAVATNGGGVAVFTVSDTAVETIVLTATDTSCGVTVGQTATVSFTASEANQSSVTVNPVSTPASGPAATVSVTLKTASGQPISGRTVSMPSVSHTTVTPLAYPGLAPGVTNANGLAQFSVTDGQVETVTLAAYDGSTELNEVATVSFTANEANQSTLSANPMSLPAVGATTTVTVALRTGGGIPIAGDSVSLSASSSAVTISPTAATTNAAGVALFTVSDPTVETPVLSALDRTTGAAIVQTLRVNFFANEQNQSTATASPTFVQVRKSSTVTVTLLGPTDTPLAGHAVKLNTGSTTTKVTVLTKGGVTTAAGQIQFGVTDTAAQALSISVQDTTTGVTLYRPVTVTFIKP